MADLICRFCGTKTGEMEDLSIVADVRCSACEAMYGEYKKMHDEYLQKCGTYEGFPEMVKKAKFKQDAFDLLLAKKKVIPTVQEVEK